MATTVPRTGRVSRRSRRVTVPSSAEMDGTSAEAISSSSLAGRRQAPAARTSAVAPNRRIAVRSPARCLLDRSAKNLLQIRDGALQTQESLQVFDLHVPEAALGLQDGQDRIAPQTVALLGEALQRGGGGDRRRVKRVLLRAQRLDLLERREHLRLDLAARRGPLRREGVGAGQRPGDSPLVPREDRDGEAEAGVWPHVELARRVEPRADRERGNRHPLALEQGERR